MRVYDEFDDDADSNAGHGGDEYHPDANNASDDDANGINDNANAI